MPSTARAATSGRFVRWWFVVHGVHVLLGDDRAQQGRRDDVREKVYSAFKGVSALAAGIAIDEGLLHLDSSVSELLPDLALGDGVGQIHLRHLLTMTSGIDFQRFGSQPAPWPDRAGEMLRRPTRGPAPSSGTPTRRPV